MVETEMKPTPDQPEFIHDVALSEVVGEMPPKVRISVGLAWLKCVKLHKISPTILPSLRSFHMRGIYHVAATLLQLINSCQANL